MVGCWRLNQLGGSCNNGCTCTSVSVQGPLKAPSSELCRITIMWIDNLATSRHPQLVIMHQRALCSLALPGPTAPGVYKGLAGQTQVHEATSGISCFWRACVAAAERVVWSHACHVSLTPAARVLRSDRTVRCTACCHHLAAVCHCGCSCCFSGPACTAHFHRYCGVAAPLAFAVDNSTHPLHVWAFLPGIAQNAPKAVHTSCCPLWCWVFIVCVCVCIYENTVKHMQVVAVALASLPLVVTAALQV